MSCRCQIRCLSVLCTIKCIWLRFEFFTLWWRVVVVVSLVFIVIFGSIRHTICHNQWGSENTNLRLTILQSCCKSCSTSFPCRKAADVIASFSPSTQKTKNKKVVAETGVELPTNRFRVNRLNQLDNITIPPLPFSRERDRNPLPFRAPLVLSMFFFISQPRVSGPKTEHESFFFRSLISCMRLANLRETKKKPPLSEKKASP